PPAGARMKSLFRPIAFAVGLALVSGASLEASVASAQTKKKKATSTKQEPAAGTPAATATAPNAPKKKEERKGPAKFTAGDKYKLDDEKKEALADQKRDESIAQLKKIIPKFEYGAEQKAELLFQLSELYWEKSQYLQRKEMRGYDEAYAKYEEAFNRGEKGLK